MSEKKSCRLSEGGCGLCRSGAGEIGGDVVIRGNLTVYGTLGAGGIHLIQVDRYGRPIVQVVDRGEWKAGELYYHATMNPASGVLETSDVWHYGCRWRCMVSGTRLEPRWNVRDWLMLEGDRRLLVSFAEDEQLYDLYDFRASLSVVVRLYGREITGELPDRAVLWSRYSEDPSGVPRPSSDAVWNERRGGSGKRLLLTASDLDLTVGVPRVLRFTATVTVNTEDGNAYTAREHFEYVQ